MSIAVKICGLTSEDAVDATIRAGADFAGLVFFPRSPRHLSYDRARALADRLRGRIRIVALLVDASDGEIADVMGAVSPDLLQLHGRETPARAGAIAAMVKRPIIKAIAVAEPADTVRAHAYEDAADYILFEGKAPEGTTRPGGTGAAFDWKMVSGMSLKRPWLLAGGLDAANVARAIQASGAKMVDVSSGVEDAPGVKSPEKISTFVKAARGAMYSARGERGVA